MSNPYTPRRYDGTKRNREYQSVNTKKEAGGSVHLCGNTTPLGTKIETDQLWNFRVVCVCGDVGCVHLLVPIKGGKSSVEKRGAKQKTPFRWAPRGELIADPCERLLYCNSSFVCVFFPALICMMGSASVVNGSDV